MSVDLDKPRSFNFMKGLAWMGIISLAFCGVLVFSDAFFGSRHHRNLWNRRAAINNARQIGLALFEFDAEFGQFPDGSTIAEVKKRTGTSLSLDDSSSNMLFRQILAYGELKSEQPFWVRTPSTPEKPDDRFDLDSTALQPGECSFAYITGLNSTDDSRTPLVVIPLLKGQRKFDPKPFQGRAIVLLLDNSVSAIPIQKDGRVIVGGMDLFDPRQPFWKGKAPNIKWPE